MLVSVCIGKPNFDERRHAAIDYMSPTEFENQHAEESAMQTV